MAQHFVEGWSLRQNSFTDTQRSTIYFRWFQLPKALNSRAQPFTVYNPGRMGHHIVRRTGPGRRTRLELIVPVFTLSLPLYRTTAWVAAAIFCTLSLLAQNAPVQFLPLSEIHAGMHGTGKTVFSGERVEDFQVEILGILENTGPKQSIILARLSGGPLERTGVMQGMSGSPVYIEGRLIGAVAMGFPFSKEPIAGIRPIEEMIRTQRPGPIARQAARASLTDTSLTAHLQPPDQKLNDRMNDSKLIDIMTPVSFSGFTSGTIEQFAPQLRALGLEPQQGVSGGASARVVRPSGRPLQPGEMISVQLVSGDMNIGADGTVTHVDGNRLYAFGHRFLSVGDTQLPFARASVLALLPNLSSSFKISATGESLGTITADNNTAITGELGRKPRTIPVSITVKNAVAPIRYKMEMVSDRLLSPLLLQMTVYSAIEATERTMGAASIGLHGTVGFEGASEPVHIDTIYSGDFNVPLQASLSTSLPLAYALQNNLENLQLKNVDLQIDSYPEKKQLQVDQVWVSKREVHPGDSLDLITVLTGDRGQELTKKVSYTVPIGAPAGTIYFTVADGSTMNGMDYQQFSLTQARSSAQILSFLGKLRGNRTGYVRVWRNDPAYQAQGEDMPNLPASLSMILARSQGSTGATPRASKIAELEFHAGDVMISGTKTVQVEVKE
jgi:hypothetical protein